jgi:phosphoglycerate dehydrogenase-like enzyme
MTQKKNRIAVLMYEPSFHRVEQQLDALSSVINPLLMSQEGQLYRRDSQTDAASKEFEVAWASPEVFIDGRLSLFMAHVLKAPKVRWLQSGSAGFDNPLLRSAMEHGIPLTVNPAPATSIAEYVFATVLDYFQDGPKRRAAQSTSTWRPATFREIAGTQWLIIGYGAIGQRVARRAKAFDVRVVAINRRGGSHEYADEIYTLASLYTQLSRADVVILALPLDSTTAGLANGAFFEHMKPAAVLVNVARGGIVDEGALLNGLDRGFPSHAVLDVCGVEPLPSSSPLWRHPRVTITAHLAGMGSGLLTRSDSIFLANLRRYLANEPLLGLVALP